MSIERTFDLIINAGTSSPLVINANQNDSGEIWKFNLYQEDGTKVIPAAGEIVGLKSDGHAIVNAGTVNESGQVVITETAQITAAVGANVFEIVFDSVHGTANFILYVEKSPVDDDADFSESDISAIQQAIAMAIDAQTVAALQVGLENEARTRAAADAVLRQAIDDAAIVPAGSTVVVDNTLSIAGAAADAKKTGDAVNDLKSALSDAIITYTGRNLFDYTKLEHNKYLNPDGTIETYSGRSITDYIPVKTGKIVTLSYIASSTDALTKSSYASICCYDQNKSVMSGGNYNKYTFTVPDNVAYVRLTLATNTYNSPKTQIELTDDGNPTQFEYYIGSDLQLNDEIVVTPKKLGYMRAKGDLGVSDSLTLPYHNVKNGNVLVFTANITSFDKLKIGKESDTYIVIDSTNITYYNDQNSSSEAHGLTIANDIQVVIKNENSINIASGGIRVTSSGHTFSSSSSHRFIMDKDSPYVVSDGSVLTDCVFSWTSRNINKPIWLFGDSYFSWYPSRWTYYLAEDGYTDSCMLNGYAGEASVDAMRALRSLLNVRVPDTVVWCIGMNNSDSSSAVSYTWLYNYTALIGLANYYGFELVLATIPNTPTINNSYKNEIVRNSGYRYIDFATAVNVGNDGSWIAGTLDTDNVHPTEYGARVLYGQVLADLPEIVSK